MSLALRTALAIVVVTAVTAAFGAAMVRGAIRSDLAVFAPNFAMMRSMMGFAPDVHRLYALVDEALLEAFGLAVALAIGVGAWLGYTLARSVRTIDRGLVRFASGRFEPLIAAGGSSPSEVRHIANSANVMAGQLRELRVAERALVAGIAHDMAHPLTAMRGTLEAVRDGLVARDDPVVARRLLASVGTLEETLGDLRDVAAYEAGQLRTELGDVDVAALVALTAERYRDFAQRRGVGLVAERTPHPLVIRSDEHHLERAVANLVINAVQASVPGGIVGIAATIGAPGNGRPAGIDVRDEAGSDAAARLASALKDGTGAGLGLRVVRTMAAAIDAELRVRATDAGSVVELRFR